MDFEYPPANGTALGRTLIDDTFLSALVIFISVIILAFIGYIAKPLIRDLV